jgi:hypothetical protein
MPGRFSHPSLANDPSGCRPDESERKDDLSRGRSHSWLVLEDWPSPLFIPRTPPPRAAIWLTTMPESHLWWRRNLLFP